MNSIVSGRNPLPGVRKPVRDTRRGGNSAAGTLPYCQARLGARKSVRRRHSRRESLSGVGKRLGSIWDTLGAARGPRQTYRECRRGLRTARTAAARPRRASAGGRPSQRLERVRGVRDWASGGVRRPAEGWRAGSEAWPGSGYVER